MAKYKIILTGSCGFIGSNFIRFIAPLYPQYDFIGIDKLVIPTAQHNILLRHQLYIGDIADPHFIDRVFDIERPDIVINMAAESFVDAAIKNALPFINTNVLGTQILVNAALKYDVKKFIQVSTDECLGQLRLGDPPWTEATAISPRNAYSASKASAELLVQAAHHTHGLQYIITRCSNNFGPRQQNRNFIPVAINSILNNKTIPVYGEGKETREWIWVEDHCLAIMHIIDQNLPMNEIYNIGSGNEMSNIELANNLCCHMGKGDICFVDNRKGHDQRYHLNCGKLKSFGWAPKTSFEDGLKKTIDWYSQNQWYLDIV